MPKPGSSRLNGILSFVIFNKSLSLVFIWYIVHILGHTNPKLCLSENAIVVNLCKITVPRKKQLNVEILHNLKEFWKEFLNIISFSK